MPRQLEAGVVYVSEEFEVATHLCACGCGNKVTTPLGPTEWSFKENRGKPTLSPSIGNWQWPCRSHYWITAGKVSWTGQWTSDQIESGRRAEEERRREYFESRKRRELSGLARIWNWFKKLFSWPRV
ncbi:MAG: DUF6527 family protein [Polyangiaceae bacterium]